LKDSRNANERRPPNKGLAADFGRSIGIAGARQDGQNPHGLLEFRGEDLRIVTMLEPPLPFPANVRSRRGREADPTLLQRARNSFTTSAASTRRPAATSASDSAKTTCKACRSASAA
jgi:hypothetical protein